MTVTLTIACYNIQYGVGQDGKRDIARIADTVKVADIILFQEVCQNWARDDHEDQVAELAKRLNRYVTFASTFDTDASTVENGRVINRRRTFGNMIASRWPILSSRTCGLPKNALPETMDLQRCAVEGIIATPVGPLRCYSVHLSHISSGQRQDQVAALWRFIQDAALDARPADGVWPDAWGAADATEVPLDAPVILGGDFNCTADAPEFAILTGELDPYRGRLRRAAQLVDTYAAAGLDTFEASTFHTRDTAYKIDHILCDARLASTVRRSWVGDSAASDHYPVFVELELADA